MPQLIHYWYWTRAQAGGYCVITSDITAERKYGHTEVPGYRGWWAAATAIYFLLPPGEPMTDACMAALAP